MVIGVDFLYSTTSIRIDIKTVGSRPLRLRSGHSPSGGGEFWDEMIFPSMEGWQDLPELVEGQSLAGGVPSALREPPVIDRRQSDNLGNPKGLRLFCSTRILLKSNCKFFRQDVKKPDTYR